MNVFGRTCEDHQRLWLLRSDGTTGWVARRANDRHLAGCTACRQFVETAGTMARRLAGAGEIEPPADRLRAISLLAADRLPEEDRRAAARLETEQRWWAGAFMGGAVLAAAAGLVLAFLHPAAFSGRPTPPSRLEARLVWAQQELDQLATESPVRPGRVSFDDRIQSLEKQMRCLDVDLDDVNWNTLKQDSACTDS